MSIESMRREYAQARLDEAEVDVDPIRQFGVWFDQAVEVNEGAWFEPNAMTLSTVTPHGLPDGRIVLLKSFDASGFVFYTNYASAKGRQLEACPYAALTFHWAYLERQVRIRGTVSQLSREVAEAYFASRPRGSQLGAAVSDQSETIARREVLEERLSELERQYDGRAVPMPETWGGYCVRPTEIEFWQGRPNRLHDRLRYRRGDDGAWRIERLSP